jgi:hypothetical protein
MCKSAIRDKNQAFFVTKVGFAHFESVTRGTKILKMDRRRPARTGADRRRPAQTGYFQYPRNNLIS